VTHRADCQKGAGETIGNNPAIDSQDKDALRTLRSKGTLRMLRSKDTLRMLRLARQNNHTPNL
jgi:hypothetical protein